MVFYRPTDLPPRRYQRPRVAGIKPCLLQHDVSFMVRPGNPGIRSAILLRTLHHRSVFGEADGHTLAWALAVLPDRARIHSPFDVRLRAPVPPCSFLHPETCNTLDASSALCGGHETGQRSIELGPVAPPEH